MKKQLSRRYSKRSDTEWLKIFDEQGKSGLSEDRFCKEQGLSLTSFKTWKKKLTKISPSKFITFDIVPPPTPSEWEAAIELPGGVVVRVSRAVAPTRIKDLLTAVKEAYGSC